MRSVRGLMSTLFHGSCAVLDVVLPLLFVQEDVQGSAMVDVGLGRFFFGEQGSMTWKDESVVSVMNPARQTKSISRPSG